jgi:hypothetical protein
MARAVSAPWVTLKEVSASRPVTALFAADLVGEPYPLSDRTQAAPWAARCRGVGSAPGEGIRLGFSGSAAGSAASAVGVAHGSADPGRAVCGMISPASAPRDRDARVMRPSVTCQAREGATPSKWRTERLRRSWDPGGSGVAPSLAVSA